MIEDWKQGKRIGIYGQGSQCVIVLHGGPGAYGSSDAVAMGLSNKFKAYSPWQRRSGSVNLTVNTHIKDLKELIEEISPNNQPALVGESWGAMLALAFASKYPERIKCIILIGCGTFTDEERKELQQRRKKRIENYIKKHQEFKEDLSLSYERQVIKWHNMTDTYSKIDKSDDLNLIEDFDQKAYDETWSDMIRCQNEGIYPNQFENITLPILMIHGEYDPHPGLMIANNLKKYIPQLEYQELQQCGHNPSIEKYAKEKFYKLMNTWLIEKTITGLKK